MNRFLKVLLILMMAVTGCNKPDEPNQNGDNTEGNDSVVDHGGVLDGHAYIDLGLSSGTLWATCNLGADSPEDFGDFYAWGDTVPKEIYDWKSYRYGNYIPERYRFEVNKYCTIPFFGVDGFVDNKTVLEPIDDAATYNWGTDWRTPTHEEWEELTLETTCEWDTLNGVKGRTFTGVNGNSVFFPAAGFYLDEEHVGFELGIYWSSSLYTGSPERAWSLHFDLDNYHVCGTYERSRGQAVRAVRCPQ